MMEESLHQRTELLLGPEKLEALAGARVLIAGVGGVGGYAAEAIMRAGVGTITVVDHDVVSLSNGNRQIIATHNTLGQNKVDLVYERGVAINPDLKITPLHRFLDATAIAEIVLAEPYDMVLDCIDSISSKILLVDACQKNGIQIISSMGAGGRMDISRIRINQLRKTDTCPLARQMRQQGRKQGIDMRLPVVYSTEVPKKGLPHPEREEGAHAPRSVNGTIAYLPAAFGLHMAQYVITHLSS